MFDKEIDKDNCVSILIFIVFNFVSLEKEMIGEEVKDEFIMIVNFVVFSMDDLEWKFVEVSKGEVGISVSME